MVAGSVGGMADPPPEDPFEGWVLDDDFVKGAFRTEYSAEERIDRMQRLDADLRRMPDDGSRRSRRAASGGGRLSRIRARVPRWWWVIVLLVIAVVAVEVYQRRDQSSAGRGAAQSVQDVFVVDGKVTDLPAVPAGVSAVPIGVPPAVPAGGGGTYEFVLSQPKTGEPVAYDPCRPVKVVVNDRTAPPGSAGLVEQAVTEVAAATGLRFEIEGPTTEMPSSSRRPVQEARYGDRWAPVLISWTDPATIAALEGPTVGVGGSQAISVGSDQSVYVTGMVALDGPQLARILDTDRGVAIVRGVIAHELGHVAGLDHVDDPAELMAPETDGATTTYGIGDRTGLARLGAGACFPDI